MRFRLSRSCRQYLARTGLTTAAFVVTLHAATLSAQPSPWEEAAGRLQATFTGPLARSLAVVAIVVGGLLFMYGEGSAKRTLAGIVFGGGLALSAVNFARWLFP